jgi:hypothetical protein
LEDPSIGVLPTIGVCISLRLLLRLRDAHVVSVLVIMSTPMSKKPAAEMPTRLGTLARKTPQGG